MKHIILAVAGIETCRKPTRKAEYLSRMEVLVPWSDFCKAIKPFYPGAGNRRPPVGLEHILRMYFIANWFNLSDEACEDALYEVPAFREFCRFDLWRERIPDAATLMSFRNLLEQNNLGETMFSRVGELLVANGILFSGGTIVDAAIIEAPSSTRNADNARDHKRVTSGNRRQNSG